MNLTPSDLRRIFTADERETYDRLRQLQTTDPQAAREAQAGRRIKFLLRRAERRQLKLDAYSQPPLPLEPEP